MKKIPKILALCLSFVLLLSIMLFGNIPKVDASSQLDEDFENRSDEILYPYFNLDTIVFGNDYSFGQFGYPSTIFRYQENDYSVSTYTTVGYEDDKDFNIVQYFDDYDEVNLGFVRNRFYVYSNNYVHLYGKEMFFPFGYSDYPTLIDNAGDFSFNVSYKVWYYDTDNGVLSYDDYNYDSDAVELFDYTIFNNQKYNRNSVIRITDYHLSIFNNGSPQYIDMYVNYDEPLGYDLSSTFYDGLVVIYNDAGSWLLNSLNSFLKFEPFPNFSLSDLLSMMIVIPLVLFLCKLFLGG